MRRITIVLTGNNEETLNRLLEQTGLNVNRLLNTLISNAVVADVVRREPVAVIPGSQQAVILPTVVRPEFGKVAKQAIALQEGRHA